MDASVIVYNLEHHSLISDGDRKMLTKNMDAMQQNQILHAQLKNKCTTKALMDVCDIITAVKGNPKMIKLGEDMKKRLEKGIIFAQLAACCNLKGESRQLYSQLFPLTLGLLSSATVTGFCVCFIFSGIIVCVHVYA